MFQGFKETVFKNKLNQLLAQTDKSRTPPLTIVKSIAIITSEDISSKIDLQKEVEKILGARNVKIYSLRNFDKKDDFSYKHFTKKILIGVGSLLNLVFNVFWKHLSIY